MSSVLCLFLRYVTASCLRDCGAEDLAVVALEEKCQYRDGRVTYDVILPDTQCPKSRHKPRSLE